MLQRETSLYEDDCFDSDLESNFNYDNFSDGDSQNRISRLDKFLWGNKTGQQTFLDVAKNPGQKGFFKGFVLRVGEKTRLASLTLTLLSSLNDV
jgi:hypothetical protein